MIYFFKLRTEMSSWIGSGQYDIDWWMGLTDKDQSGEFTWSSSGEKMENASWWKDSEPDKSGSCVALSADSGLYDEDCSAKKTEAPEGNIVRRALCMLGNFPKVVTK